MEEFIKQMAAKVGIDQPTAEKVVHSLQQNPAEVSQAVAGKADALGPLVEKLGLSKDVVSKVIEFLKQHAAELPKLLAGAPGLIEKAKGALGGLVGGKG